MRRQPDLMINGLVFPAPAAGQITQTYADIGGFARRRAASGRLIAQEAWRRISTSISAEGWVPAALDSIDWSGELTLGCIAARARQSDTPSIALPAARRTDAAPYGFAVVGHRLVPTSLAVAGDLATLAPVAGATAYKVLYYPLLIVRSDGPSERYDAGGAVAGFDLQAEEI
ncbi:hypothetical protein dqs_0632 [Azoarcus olearius]|uniref:hypothetical protein n=1 Tax=Azoarcus sp. (strain BH72) TaxID=418699 RepID=UPI0008060A1E|nr:hypothetical protein [Azoarcus olearius]ANQ83708.1 hypothetical protein dqs_0632 [Azoarcus olearius]